MDTSTGAVMVRVVVPAIPEVDVAVMVTTPSAVPVAMEEFAGKVAAPEGSGAAVQVTAVVRFCVEPSV
jgi:hypothetical protein